MPKIFGRAFAIEVKAEKGLQRYLSGQRRELRNVADRA
jgi:hypothetical protein